MKMTIIAGTLEKKSKMERGQAKKLEMVAVNDNEKLDINIIRVDHSIENKWKAP